MKIIKIEEDGWGHYYDEYEDGGLDFGIVDQTFVVIDRRPFMHKLKSLLRELW